MKLKSVKRGLFVLVFTIFVITCYRMVCTKRGLLPPDMPSDAVRILLENRVLGPEDSSVIYNIISKVKQDHTLLKEARRIGGRDRKNINAMIKQLIRGGDPGIKGHPLGKGVHMSILEARVRGGVRIYYQLDKKNNLIKIIAYSNKNNQATVIKRLKKLYPR